MKLKDLFDQAKDYAEKNPSKVLIGGAVVAAFLLGLILG